MRRWFPHPAFLFTPHRRLVHLSRAQPGMETHRRRQWQRQCDNTSAEDDEAAVAATSDDVGGPLAFHEFRLASSTPVEPEPLFCGCSRPLSQWDARRRSLARTGRVHLITGRCRPPPSRAMSAPAQRPSQVGRPGDKTDRLHSG